MGYPRGRAEDVAFYILIDELQFPSALALLCLDYFFIPPPLPCLASLLFHTKTLNFDLGQFRYGTRTCAQLVKDCWYLFNHGASWRVHRDPMLGWYIPFTKLSIEDEIKRHQLT
jgi:hypothetical protein